MAISISWEECLQNNIRRIEPDYERAKSILKMCYIRKMSMPGPNDDNAFIIIESYYEIVKELLTATMALDGLKSNNHECLVRFFETKFKLEYEASIIQNLKNLRNRIQYEGYMPKKEFIERNKLELDHIIKLIRDKISESLDKTIHDKTI